MEDSGDKMVPVPQTRMIILVGSELQELTWTNVHSLIIKQD